MVNITNHMFSFHETYRVTDHNGIVRVISLHERGSTYENCKGNFSYTAK